MNAPEVLNSMDPSPLLVPIMPLGFHPESLPRHHSAFAAVLSNNHGRKFINNNTNANNNTSSDASPTTAVSAKSTSTVNNITKEVNTTVEVNKRKLETAAATLSDTDEDSASAAAVEVSSSPAMKKAKLTFEIDSVMRLPPSAQSGICQQRAKEDNQRKLSDAACKQQQKRYK